MIRFVVFVIGLVTLSCIFITTVSAEEAKLRLRILPQDCIFDVIDAGTQELYYYTPEECGVYVPEEVDPLPEDSPSSGGNIPLSNNPISEEGSDVSSPQIKVNINGTQLQLDWPTAWLITLLFAIPLLIRAIFRFFIELD